MSITPGELRITCFDTFEAAAPAWLRFEEGADFYGVQRLAWLEHWHATVGRGFVEQLCIVQVQLGDRPLLFLPLGVLRLGTAACLTWLGGDITDYHGPLLASGFSEEVNAADFAAIWETVLAALPEHDVLRLHKQPEQIGNQPNPFLALPGTAPHDINHWCALQPLWETFYPGLINARLRGDSRRKRRRLAEQGRLEFVVADSPTVMHAINQGMIEQKADRYASTGTYSLFNDNHYRSFFLEPSARLVDSGMLHVSALRLDGRALATHWGIVSGGRFYFIMAGFAAGEWERFSPGRLLIEDLLHWCCDHGVREFDFTIGDEDFKHTWSNRRNQLHRLMQAKTLRGSAFIARERLADWIRNHPGLHRRISRVRNTLRR